MVRLTFGCGKIHKIKLVGSSLLLPGVRRCSGWESLAWRRGKHFDIEKFQSSSKENLI
jgi:hypothetical protein